jgi:hypothetical protein
VILLGAAALTRGVLNEFARVHEKVVYGRVFIRILPEQ